jgi:peptidoglycan hydrolase CwlO-like protein
MNIRKKRNAVILIFLAAALIFVPFKVYGEVAPITDVEDKLENITSEEMKVLQQLFTLSQEITGLEKQEGEINADIDELEVKISDLDKDIDEKQKDYDLQLGLLEQVLVNYQRNGPASYLEILLSADNLSTFLKSLNIMKDISHNVNQLLTTLQDGKKVLEEERNQLKNTTALLEQKKVDLVSTITEKEKVQIEQQDYLLSLQSDKAFYQEQLDNLTQRWEDCRLLFPSISDEISSIIGAGYFTLEDLNLDSSVLSMTGYIADDTFNRILTEHSTVTQTSFRFEEDQVVIEVPEEHLILKGNFIISGESAIQYEVTEGTFYDMPLEAASIDELFENGPLLIDFDAITGDMIIIDFELNDVWSTEDALNFVIIPKF